MATSSSSCFHPSGPHLRDSFGGIPVLGRDLCSFCVVIQMEGDREESWGHLLLLPMQGGSSWAGPGWVGGIALHLAAAGSPEQVPGCRAETHKLGPALRAPLGACLGGAGWPAWLGPDFFPPGSRFVGWTGTGPGVHAGIHSVQSIV